METAGEKEGEPPLSTQENPSLPLSHRGDSPHLSLFLSGTNSVPEGLTQKDQKNPFHFLTPHICAGYRMFFPPLLSYTFLSCFSVPVSSFPTMLFRLNPTGSRFVIKKNQTCIRFLPERITGNFLFPQNLKPFSYSSLKVQPPPFAGPNNLFVHLPSGRSLLT